MGGSARTLLLSALAAASLGGCERETRPLVTPPETGPQSIALTDLYPGSPAPPPKDPRADDYAGNAYHITQGQTYYRWYNCNGCHANGGGGMGPPLMDDKWRYGGEMEHIYATIVQGRPNGMPSFRDKIPAQQVWQIAAYVRSLSGNVDRFAAPSRPEGMRSIPPINNINPQPPKGADAANVRSTG